MPQVPGLVPDVVPSTQGTPEVNLPVPVEAFGGAVGHALQGFGADLDKASSAIWTQAVNNQNLANETTAKEADAKYMMESGKLHAEFINREGLNAGPEALAAHIQQLQDLRTSIRAGLNPAAARMYDGSSLSFMGRNIFNAAGHSGQQGKVAASQASQGRVETLGNAVGDNPNDEIGFRRAIQAQKAEIESQGQIHGWDPDTVKANQQATVSTTVSKRLTGMSKENSLGAQKLLNEAIKSNSITPNDADRVQATITNNIADQGARNITNQVLADRRAGEEEDDHPEDYYIDKGMTAVDKVPGLTDDQRERLRDRVRTSIGTKYRQQRSIEVDSDNQNVRTIGRALVKQNAEGQFPTTIEELKAIDPAVSPAWDALGRDPRKQQAILNQLQHNAAGTNRVPTTPENLLIFHELKGMALSNDTEKQSTFLAKSIATDNRLSLPQRNTLMNIQDQLRKGQYDDPRVGRALKILGPDMQAAGVEKKQPEDYYQFVGGLQDALETFQQGNPNKVPTAEEVRTIGAQLMKEQNTHWWQSHEAFYQLSTPSHMRDSISREWADAHGGVVPNDAQVDRAYRAKLFRGLYGKKESSGP